MIAVITAGVAAALITSEESGTGATDVGDRGDAGGRPDPGSDSGAGNQAGSGGAGRPARCEPTQSNPGGTNNYIPEAPRSNSLGSGFVIRGTVRAADGCRPLEGVRVQVWLATDSGDEEDNRASTFTGSDAFGGMTSELRQVGQSISKPAALSSTAIRCWHSGHANLNSAMD